MPKDLVIIVKKMLSLIMKAKISKKLINWDINIKKKNLTILHIWISLTPKKDHKDT